MLGIYQRSGALRGWLRARISRPSPRRKPGICTRECGDNHEIPANWGRLTDINIPTLIINAKQSFSGSTDTDTIRPDTTMLKDVTHSSLKFEVDMQHSQQRLRKA